MSLEGPFRRTWFYYTARFLTLVWLKIWESFRVEGVENVPGEGGCVIAANHVSFLDPPALACGLSHRVIHFLARDTLFKPGLPRWFLTRAGCIPVDRTRGDIGALRKAISVLKEGQVLALFPEGTRSPDGKLRQAKGGVGFLIAKAGVPVVPAYVAGSYEAYPKGAKKIGRGRVRMIYGKPISPEEIAALGSDKAAYEELGRLIMGRIAEIKQRVEYPGVV